jgi:chromosome segregation protein
MEIQEISFRNEQNIDSEISFKQREIERVKITLKQLCSDEADLKDNLKSINEDLEEKENNLQDKKIQEEQLTVKFKKMLSERDSLQMKVHENELGISQRQNELHNGEQIVNNLKIAKAKLDAEHENLQIEMMGFENVEIIKINREALIQKLNHAQEILMKIGTVNLRSLEVYDSIKKEYDTVKEKSELIEKEKGNVLKIINEIDIKKKKTFNKTLDFLNEIFSRNFAQLSTKGNVSLEVENRKDPFSGGVNIIVKTGHGKYFDVTSLSGGEQTLVAISLIFAIQEYKPYCFYIVDEIDAALDKRNSQRLGELLKKYMKQGQYIIISHNDEIISSATSIYGVSMHDGVSKMVSLKL